MSDTPALLAVSDLHVSHADNWPVVEALQPTTPDDWLIVAGDVAERADDVVRVLALLRQRFGTVVWVPGNHELWTTGKDPVQLRGQQRYDHLVRQCRDLGVLTPEDELPVWRGLGGPLRIAPLFPDPYPTRDAWCRARVAEAERRLAACDPDVPLVLVNHWPLVREPTRVLRHPEFALWCGTQLTADWHTRFPVAAAVYGHLHIPRTTWHDGVPFCEVSLWYPREWRRRGRPDPLLRPVHHLANSGVAGR